MTTSKYLLLYRSPVDAPARPPMTPAAMEAAMAQWKAWKEKFKDEIVDMGDGLTRVGAVCRPNGVTDGPYVESKEIIGGYMIVATSSLERAIQIAKEGPMSQSPGSSVEVRALAGKAAKMG